MKMAKQFSKFSGYNTPYGGTYYPNYHNTGYNQYGGSSQDFQDIPLPPGPAPSRRGGYQGQNSPSIRGGYQGQNSPSIRGGYQGQNYSMVPDRGNMPGSYPIGQKREYPSGGFGGNRGGGGGRPQSQPSFGFAKRPRWGEKDDSKIPVDQTLIDKRFNFWNLPSKAKVLLVSNIPQEIAKPKALFCLFSFYGDIPKIKILPKKQNAAFIEFATATMACIARNNLDQVKIRDKKLYVSFSKYHEIKQNNEEEAPFIMDFSGEEYKLLQRYNVETNFVPNLKRVCKPSQCLHINNFPKGHTVRNIRATIEGVGLNILDIVGCKKIKEKDVNPDKPSRAFVYVW